MEDMSFSFSHNNNADWTVNVFVKVHLKPTWPFISKLQRFYMWEMLYFFYASSKC